MNDERFFDLAMKVIARQSTDAERAELDALLAQQPELKKEYERLQADVRTAKDALPLVDATQATASELPAYARGRLQTKVRETLGRPAEKKEPDRSLAWGWRWVLGLAATTAVVLLVALPMFRTPSAPVIQLAMLDTTGGTRGSDTNEMALLQQAWTNATLSPFVKPELLGNWETNWPATKRAVKVIYDRNAGEVRVLGRWNNRSFEHSFQIETNLSVTLQEAQRFVREQTGFDK